MALNGGRRKKLFVGGEKFRSSLFVLVKAMGDEFYRRQRELLGGVLAEQHVVITTAAVAGRKAPILITREMAARMAVLPDIAGVAWSADEGSYHPTLFVQGSPVADTPLDLALN